MGGGEEGSERLVLRLLLVFGLAPGCDSLSVEDDDVEEGVEEEDRVLANALRIEEDGLRRRVEAATSAASRVKLALTS